MTERNEEIKQEGFNENNNQQHKIFESEKDIDYIDEECAFQKYIQKDLVVT